MAGIWGAGGRASGFRRGKAPVSPQLSCLLPLSGRFSREGRGTWLPAPEATLSSLSPDHSHPEAWLGPSLRIQLWGQLHFRLVLPSTPAVTPPFLVSRLKLVASPPFAPLGTAPPAPPHRGLRRRAGRSPGALAVPECATSCPGRPVFSSRGGSWPGDRGQESGQARERAAG